ncbi:hypothetical protein ACFW2X_33500, partial [Streptomyces antibioticus]
DPGSPAGRGAEARDVAESAAEEARTSRGPVPGARTPDPGSPAGRGVEARDVAESAAEEARTSRGPVPGVRTPDTGSPANRTGEAGAEPADDRVPAPRVAGPGQAEPAADHDRAPGPFTDGVRADDPAAEHDRARRPAGAAGAETFAKPPGAAEPTAPEGVAESPGSAGSAAPPASALPRRVRQASLAAPLRDEPPARDTAPEREVDAEEMRAVFGSFQRGLERGRQGLPTRTDGDEGTEADHAQ